MSAGLGATPVRRSFLVVGWYCRGRHTNAAISFPHACTERQFLARPSRQWRSGGQDRLQRGQPAHELQWVDLLSISASRPCSLRFQPSAYANQALARCKRRTRRASVATFRLLAPQFITTGQTRLICFAHFPPLELGGVWVFTGFRSLIRVKISAVRYCRRGSTPGPMDGIEVDQSPNPCAPLAITTIAGGSIEVDQGERT